MATDTTKDALIYQRVLCNIFSNYVGALVALGTGVFLTPFILHKLGSSDFGLWVLVGAVVVYGSLLDFGIGGAVIKYVFFFQAEDGIRDLTVTGVQTCALPI